MNRLNKKTKKKLSIFWKILASINIVFIILILLTWFFLILLLFVFASGAFGLSSLSSQDIFFILFIIFIPPLVSVVLLVSSIGIFMNKQWAKKLELYVSIPLKVIILIYSLFLSPFNLIG